MPAYFSQKISKKSIEIFKNLLTKCFLYGIIYMQSREAQRAKIKGVNIMELNLKGTEKQIAWATDLINDAMNTIEKNLETHKNGTCTVFMHDGRVEQRQSELDVYYVQVYTELKSSLEKTIAKLETAAQVIDNRDILNPWRISKEASRKARKLDELAQRERFRTRVAQVEAAKESKSETKPETTETKTETTETKTETPAKSAKKIIIDGKEVSISEALRSKLFYRALDHDLVGIIEDDARKAAHKAADDRCDVDDMFNGYGGKWHEAFLSAYLEAAENDLVIDTAEIERQEATIAEREEAEALARIDMLP